MIEKWEILILNGLMVLWINFFFGGEGFNYGRLGNLIFIVMGISLWFLPKGKEEKK